MKRHESVFLRKPENIILAWATNFNKPNVDEFMNNYEYLLQEFKFTVGSIFNLDETGITTVLQSPKVITASGQKQVRQNVSSERGKLVTVCWLINALDNTVPPVYIYPRKGFKRCIYKRCIKKKFSFGISRRLDNCWQLFSNHETGEKNIEVQA